MKKLMSQLRDKVESQNGVCLILADTDKAGGLYSCGSHIDIAVSLAYACHKNEGLSGILKMAIDAYENVPYPLNE